MSEGKGEKTTLAQASQLARDSSLFSTASFHEHMLMKKKDSSRSTLEFAHEPGSDQPKRKLRLTYENTYQLEPAKRFQSSKVKTIIQDVLESHLKDEKYDPNSCRQLVKTLTEIIKGRVKDLQFARYKVVCMVTIGQLNEQGFRMGSRCVWDANRDTFATSNYKNKSLFAIGSVWGVYLE